MAKASKRTRSASKGTRSASRRTGSVASGSKLTIFPKAQAAGSGNLDLGQRRRKVNVEDAKVTGHDYEGYKRKMAHSGYGWYTQEQLEDYNDQLIGRF